MKKYYQDWQDDEDEWPGYNERGREPAKWELKRTWVLKKCKLTGDLIVPGTKGWCKTYYHYYNGKPAFSDWVTVEAYTFEILKGTGRLAGDL